MTAGHEAIIERVRKAIASQEQPTVTVLSSLLAIQDELGYIPQEAIEEVATRMKTTLNEVWGVASFYTNFRSTPPGEHTVEVCWGPTCHMVGAVNILKQVQDDLGLEGEGDTPDGKVTLRYNTCLGACSQAPVISVDHRLMGRMTPEKAHETVSALRSGEASHDGRKAH